MPLDPYAALLSLSPEEQRQLAFLTEEDEQFEDAVTKSAEFWMKQLRPRCPDPSLCRQMFLAHAMAKVTSCEKRPVFSRRVLLALVLTLSDKVVARVGELESRGAYGRQR